MARTLTDSERLKKEWMEMPTECFEPLTFGELKIGQKFIGLPQPGDNQGHGGLRKACFLFVKTNDSIEPPSALPDNALNIGRGIPSHFSDQTFVLLVE